MSLKNLIFAALFHDLSKLFLKVGGYSSLEEAKKLFSNSLPQIIEDCIKYNHFKNLKENQNSICPETWLIYEADNIAAGRDKKEFFESENNQQKTKLNAKTALISTFDFLGEISDQEPETKKKYKLQMLCSEDTKFKDPEIIYPQNNQENQSIIYQTLAKRWDEQVSKNKDILSQNPNALLTLLENLLAYAPSENLEDVSLYEHSKITASIASCMYLYAQEKNIDFKDLGHWDKVEKHRNEKQFLLVGGSVSGIQKFIYNITSKGALKGLRARSFYLEVLIEHIIDEILELVGDLSRANIIYSGGGNFYLLLPNTNACLDALSKVEQKLTIWLWENFRGSLSFAIDSIDCSSMDLMDKEDKLSGKRKGLMPKKWKELSQKLSEKKNKKFSLLDEQAFHDIFQPQQNTYNSDECAISRVDHDLIDYKFDDEIKKCNFMAASLHSLGGKLPKANFIRIEKNKEKIEKTSSNFKENCVFLPDLINENKECWLSLIIETEENITNIDEKKEILNNIKNNRLYSINRWVINKAIYAVLTIGNYYAAQFSDCMPTFEDLAKESIGNEKIGVLRADVDDLGTLFRSKLEAEINTFSRSAMLAKHLSMFFKLYINQICRKKLGETLEPYSFIDSNDQEKERNVVIVYSGGDDLFIVGAWNEIIELSIDIQKCFEKYTCQKLTLSAGVQVFAPKIPIIQMAEQTGIAEKKAKNNKYKNKTQEKNSICIFPNPRELEYKTLEPIKKRDSKYSHKDTYNWNEFKELLQNTKAFQSFIQDNSSFAYKLYSTVENLFFEGDQGLINLPRLAYMLARLEDRVKDQKEIIQKFDKAINNYLLEQENKNADQDIGLRLKDIKTLTTIVSYLERKK